MDIESVPDVLNGGAGGDDLLGLGSAAEVDKLLMKSPVSPGKCFFLILFIILLLLLSIYYNLAIKCVCVWNM